MFNWTETTAWECVCKSQKQTARTKRSNFGFWKRINGASRQTDGACIQHILCIIPSCSARDISFVIFLSVFGGHEIKDGG
jgi:hypothetical protein